MKRLTLCLLLLAGPADAGLTIRPAPGTSDPWRIQVEGHRVSAQRLVSAIADHLGWKVHWSVKDQEDLRAHFLTLEVPDRHARSILELIAACCGKEVDLEPDLEVVLIYPEATARTRSGRRVLRERAVRFYREALLDTAHGSETLDIQGRLADLFMQAEDYVAAAREWREIVENRGRRALPGDLYPRASLGAGLALEKLRRYEEARQFYVKLIRDFRESDFLVPALLGNSRCLFATERARDGIGALERYLANPRYFQAYIGHQHEPALRLTLARGYFLAGDSGQCIAVLEPVLSSTDLARAEHAGVFLLGGQAALAARHMERAVDWLGTYLRLTPPARRSNEAWIELGEALSASGRQLEALAALAELKGATLERASRRRLALVHSGVEMRLGRPARAGVILAAALEAAGGAQADPRLALALAHARLDAGEMEAARVLFRALLESGGAAQGNPELEAIQAEASLGLVGALLRQGYHEDALAEARRFLGGGAADPHRRDLYQSMLEALVRAGRLNEALEEVLR